MSLTREIDIPEFARRVERLCDFFLNQTARDGSNDRKFLEDLKDDAANLQLDRENYVIKNLYDYVNGV